VQTTLKQGTATIPRRSRDVLRMAEQSLGLGPSTRHEADRASAAGAGPGVDTRGDSAGALSLSRPRSPLIAAPVGTNAQGPTPVSQSRVQLDALETLVTRTPPGEQRGGPAGHDSESE